MIANANFPNLDVKFTRGLMLRVPKRAPTLVLAGFRTVKPRTHANFWLFKSKSDPKNVGGHFTVISRVNMVFNG